MGRVYRARDLRTGSDVALKILHDDLPAEAAARFERECDALVRLAHPSIVRYVARGLTPEGAAYLAMEWIEGEELRLRLRRGPLRADETVALGARLAAALAHAHERGVMHRDVKPSNVVLRRGEIEDCVLVDFGLARTADDELTRTGMLVGTPTYMAPEQIHNQGVTPSVDVFALGCLLHVCLAGEAPFAANGATAVLARVLFDEPTSLATAAPSTPGPLCDLVARMLRKSNTERPAMIEVAEALEAMRAEEESPPTMRRGPRLSAAEQRIVSVIVAGAPPAADANATLRFAHGPAGAADVARLQEVAARFGAELSALPSGALVAVLTAREAATDLVERAAECSLRMKEVVSSAPFALATGRARAGGGIPVGEAIDRAPALDAVRIDAVTSALLPARFEQTADDEGALLRSIGGADAARTLLGKPTPCVGRDAEVAMLEGVVTQSASEAVARVVLVTAPAGTGKSRIRWELCERIRKNEPDAALWVARGDSVAAGAPFAMIAQIVRGAAGILAGESPASARDKLLARTRSCGDPKRVAMFLAETIGLHFEDDDVQLRAARSDPRLMGDQLQRAFVDFCEAECAERPLVIVLEDLQWGDAPTIGALDAALRLMSERPIAVIGFARPEVTETFPDLFDARGVQIARLAPLPRKAAERLARTVLGEGSDEAAAELVERAGGNVFFLEELLRAKIEGRPGEVPATVVAMVQSRLAAIDPAARRVLRAASIFGETFSHKGLRALLGDDAAGADRWIRELVDRELVARRARTRLADDVEYAFRHALVREGAYAMLTDEDRTLGHRLAADWLAQCDAPALVVATHLERAGESGRAAVEYLRAAEQALESSDLAGAIDLAGRGVALGASGELLGALRAVQAHAHHWRGETSGMETAAADAMRLLPRGDSRWAEATAMFAVAEQRLGKAEDLRSVARDLLSMVEHVENRPALAHACGRVASALFFAGKQDVAATMLDAAERVGRGCGAGTEARIHQARAPHARQAGRPADALAHAEAAEAAFRTAGDRRNQCMMTGIRGFALSELGAYEDAERVLCEALDAAERLGLATVAAGARSNLGVVFLRRGRHDEAEAIERAAIRELEARDRRNEGGSRAYLAMILRERGLLEEAEAEARRAVALLDAALALRPLAGAVLATILLAGGRAREALDTTRDALKWLESGGNVEEGDALLRVTAAQAMFATGDRSRARHVLDAARVRLIARADTIRRPELRRSFLEKVPEHALTLALKM